LEGEVHLAPDFPPGAFFLGFFAKEKTSIFNAEALRSREKPERWNS
jgi:hypothetical protein